MNESEKGLTLVELLLAVSISAILLTGGSALMLSIGRSDLRVQTENIGQGETFRFFAAIADDTRNMVIDANAVNVTDTTANPKLLCSVPTSGVMSSSSQGASVHTGSPCVECYNGSATYDRYCELQFNTLGDSSATAKTITYYYHQLYDSTEKKYTLDFTRKVESVTAAGATTTVSKVLSSSLFAYADADMNFDGVASTSEKTARDTCFTTGVVSTLLSTNCWLNASKIFPAFSVKDDGTMIRVSVRNRLGAPGATKTFYARDFSG